MQLSQSDWWQVYLLARDAADNSEKVLRTMDENDVLYASMRAHVEQMRNIQQAAEMNYAG